MIDLRYPLGPLAVIAPATGAARRAAIKDLAAAPELMRTAVGGLSDTQLDTPYQTRRMDGAPGRAPCAG